MKLDTIQTKILLSIIFIILSIGKVQAATETYAVDPSHTSVQFHVRHFFTNVTGRFDQFEGVIIVNRDNLEQSEIKASIDTVSINTNQTKRDTHLKSADYFDVEKYPKMTFESKIWKKITDNEFEVSGDLTLHGITKPITLNVKSLGFGEGMQGSKISGWEAKTNLKRSEFGITSGTPAVGDDVQIEINIEANLK